MPRKTAEEIAQEKADKKTESKEKLDPEQDAIPIPDQQQAEIVEVPINLELLNNKLNHIITELAGMKNFILSLAPAK